MSNQAEAVTRSFDGLELPLPGTYVIDRSFSHVGFAVRHLMVSKVRGTFGSFEGTATIADDPTESSLQVTVDVASVDTRDAPRDAQIRTEAFFDVDRFPEMTFRSTAVRRNRDRWVVYGELTLHGVTRPQNLDVAFEGAVRDPFGNVKVAFSATGELDRDDFGLTWNMPLSTGGVAVGKKVAIEIEAELASI